MAAKLLRHDGRVRVRFSVRALEDGEGMAEERLRFGVAPQGIEDRRQGRAVGRGGRMFGAEQGHADLDRASGQRLGRRVVAAGVGEATEVVEERRPSQRIALSEGKGPPVGVFCLVEAAAVLEADTQPVEELDEHGIVTPGSRSASAMPHRYSVSASS